MRYVTLHMKAISHPDLVQQTDIVAVQRVYYNQFYNFSCESGD